jgi:hypothetical protein
MPYPGRLREDGFWPYMGSRSIDPLYVLLEFLWIRLAYKFNISSTIFGEDLEREGVNTLLMMKAVREGDRQGWAYEYIEAPEEELNKGNLNEPWEPAEVSDVEAVVLIALGKKEEISEDDPDIVAYVRSQGAELNDVFNSLVKKRLVYREAGVIKYLTDSCTVIALPDGRLTRWALRHQSAEKAS